MRVPISWLKDYVDLYEPIEVLAERLTLAGLEVEAVDRHGDAEILEIATTADLSRCMSVIGIAREVAALTGERVRLPAGSAQELPDDASAFEVEIADPHLCNRYIGALVRDVTLGESPGWMCQRLREAGLQSINNLVDITNYVMLEYGQPLHAFDHDLLVKRAAGSGRPQPLIRVRAAEPGERITTLDEVERTLNERILLITDSAGPLGIAGIMGGLESGIQDSTRNVLLEAATFNGIAVRQAAQQLRLHTEASSRFSRGVPATLNALAVGRALDLFERYAGGRPAAIVDRYPEPQRPRVAYIAPSEVRRQLGIEVDLAGIVSLLERLEFQVETVDGGALPTDAGEATLGLRVEPGEPVLRCTAPWYRLDVELPADLTEEVARMIGYASIPPARLAEILPPPEHNEALETEERLRDLLVGCGLQEHINYSLTTVENHEKLGVAPEDREQFIILSNPLTANRRVLRRSLLVSAVEALPYNLRYNGRERSFEIGRVYLPEQGDGIRPREERRLSLLLTGPRRRGSVHPDPEAAGAMDFFDLKGILEAVLDAEGWRSKTEFVPCSGEPVFGPRCAEIRGPDGRIGVLGELHPAVAERFDLAGRRICLAELLIEPLVKGSWRVEVVPPLSNYPPVVEDLAFVVREEVTAHDLAVVIRRAGGALLAGLELFDVYRGDSLPPGMKSLAFQLTFQGLESTPGDAEVSALRRGIEEAVAAAVDGKLRA